MTYKDVPLNKLLSDRNVFEVFDEEFHKGSWLDVTALLASDSVLSDLYQDDTVPTEVLDRIAERLEAM